MAEGQASNPVSERVFSLAARFGSEVAALGPGCGRLPIRSQGLAVLAADPGAALPCPEALPV
jgi:hypothetical protein